MSWACRVSRGWFGLVAFLIAVGATAAESELADTTQPSTEVGSPLPSFQAKLLEVSGTTPVEKDFDSTRQDRITAYVVIGTRCEASRAYAKRLNTLERTYGPKRVDFVYLYPNREDKREAILAFHKEHELGGPLIDDRGGAVAFLIGAQSTSEAVLADERGKIVYRGAIDDARDPAAVKERYLQAALEQTLAGKPVAVTTTRVNACEIHF